MKRRFSSVVAVGVLTFFAGCFSDDGGPASGSGSGDETSAGTETNGGETGTESGSGSGTTGTTGTTTDTATDTTTDTDPTATTTDPTATTGATPCGDANVCVPQPDGWEGPIAVADADAGCGGTYPDEAASLFGDFAVDAASCKCTCGNPTVQCSKTMHAVGYSQANCVNAQGQNNITENQCYNTFSASHAVTLAAASSSCAGGNVTPTLPDPSWAKSVVACDGFTPGDGECDPGDLCVPSPGDGFAGGVCYFKDGDNACPDGFPTKTLYYTGVDDTRMCPNTCSCTAGGAQCKVSITGYANQNCSSAQGAKTAYSGGDVCAASSSVVKSIKPGAVTVNNAGTCTPGAANLSGEVQPNGATTVCCTG